MIGVVAHNGPKSQRGLADVAGLTGKSLAKAGLVNKRAHDHLTTQQGVRFWSITSERMVNERQVGVRTQELGTLT